MIIQAVATIFRVKEVFGLDVVLAEEVSGYGRPDSFFSINSQLIKSSAMALSGVDSFWRVSGERDEKPVSLKQEKPYRPGSKTQSYTAFTAKSSLPLINPTAAPAPAEPSFAPSGDPLTYRSETKLEVGYSHPLKQHSKTLEQLLGPGLPCPSKQHLAAIEVADGLWLRHEQLTSSDRLLFAPGQQKRDVQGFAILAEPAILRVGGGLCVFLDPIQWSETSADCRNDQEIDYDVMASLHRLSLFAGQPSQSEDIQHAFDTLRNALSGSVASKEIDDLSAAIKRSEAKPHLSRLLPELLRNDPYWRDQVTSIIARAVEAKKSQIDEAFGEEIAQKEQHLEVLRAEVLDAERRLSTAEERERAYRASAEDVQKLIENQVSSVARDILEPLVESRLDGIRPSSDLHADIEKLSTRLAQIEQMPPPKEIHVEAKATVTAQPAVSTTINHSRDERSFLFNRLQSHALLPPSDLAFVLARMLGGGFPVLAGQNADAVAIAIATMLGGDSDSVIFCDPTKVTVSDLSSNGDAQGSLSAVVERAKATNGAFVPMVLAGLTKSPCEFWLPALLEGRRTGAFPANIVMIGTVAPDGMRIEMPNSLLRRVEPVEVKGGDDAVMPFDFQGAALWPIPAPEEAKEHSSTAIEMLSLFEGDGHAIAEALRNLSVAHFETDFDAPDIAQRFSDRQAWLSSLHPKSAERHPLSRFFSNFEG